MPADLQFLKKERMLPDRWDTKEQSGSCRIYNRKLHLLRNHMAGSQEPGFDLNSKYLLF
jgi:hypothetical protein